MEMPWRCRIGETGRPVGGYLDHPIALPETASSLQREGGERHQCSNGAAQVC